MLFNDVIKNLEGKKNGSYFNMTWYSEVPVKANFKNIYKIMKVSTGTVRKGINYSNLKSVKQRKEAFEVALKAEPWKFTQQDIDKHLHVGALPWGNWMQGYKNVLIEHINKQNQYKVYLRLYSSPNKTLTNYLINGKPVTKEQLQKMDVVLNSYWDKKESLDCFNVAIDHIVNIF
jgi:hypothetical protein